MAKKTKQLDQAPNVPLDIIVKVAFFIPDWSTVLEFLRALRPANVLGPLEHLWQLRCCLGWNDYDLWPQLNLIRMDDASQPHVEGIARFYPKVIASYITDVAWCDRFLNRNASIYWARSAGLVMGPKLLLPWTPFRIISIDLVNFDPQQLEETLSYLKHLEILKYHGCSPTTAPAIFSFVASSLSLQELLLGTMGGRNPDHCTMTTNMTADLVKWLESQPIRRLEMENFTWQDPKLRHQAMTMALASPTLEEFKMKEVYEPLLIHEAEYNLKVSALSLTFCDPLQDGDQFLDYEGLKSYLALFAPLLQTKLKRLNVVALFTFGFNNLWSILAPMIAQSHLQKMDLVSQKFTKSEAVDIANIIRHHQTLQELVVVSDNLPITGAKSLLSAATPQIKKLALAGTEDMLRKMYTPKQCDALKKLANDKSIQLFDHPA
ncbi:hypothetical protein AeRB84_011911 [Aphanomyces euteiches]|nr:hypothetical protein AeRB84_011911 [Aphanomyces euteiches]